jgi:dephospho-CoA kinase
MIKLLDLLKEIAEKPKAIFLSGPAGAGKSYTIKQLIQPDQFKIINVDDTYEELLKTAGLGLSQKDFGPEELSQAAKLMAQANQATKEKYAELSSQLQNIIIDGTGAAIKPLLKKKEELEALGYETFMIMIWVSPITSLERNVERGNNKGRSLLPQIVLRTWRDVNKNINEYRNIFRDKFVLINNNPKEAETDYNAEDIKKRFFDTATFKGKEKTPEEMAKAKADKEQLNSDVEQLVKTIPEFDSIDQAKSKINTFIK